MLPEKVYNASTPLGRRKAQDIEAQFNHVSNWEYVKTAINDYLASKGFPKQLHVAEVIMFMERSFKGKYLQNERSHFQFVMPPTNVTPSRRVGDSLSEKIPKCKHKDSFNKKFSIVGHTEIIRQNHFNERSLNFEGKMYLRMIDTNDGNVSWFYRNDEIAHRFIQEALRYKADYMERSGRIIWSGGTQLYGEVGVDYMESLLTTNTIQEYPKKTVKAKTQKERKTFDFSVGNTTTNDTTNFEGNCTDMTTEKKLNKSYAKGKTFTTASMVLGSKLHISEVLTFDEYFPKTHAYPEGNITGNGLYRIWRDAVTKHKLARLAPKEIAKSSKDFASLLVIFETFCDAYPPEEFPIFLETIASEWSSAKNHLKSTNWGDVDLKVPTIGVIRYSLSDLDTWYQDRKDRTAQLEAIEQQRIANSLAKQSAQKEGTNLPNSTLQNSDTVVQSAKVVNKFEKSSAGYTYIGHGNRYNTNGTENRTFEDDYVEAMKSGNTVKANQILAFLEKKAVKFNVSKERIDALLCS